MTTGTTPLGDLCRVQIGHTPRRNEPSFWNGTNPWASIRDLINGHVWETREEISDLAVSTVMPPITTKGTILVSFKLTIGRVAIAGRNLHHNEAIASLPIIRSDLIDCDYLRHVLPRVMERERTNIAVLGHVLNKAKLQSLPIPLPPLNEQRQIVRLLDRAAEIRRRAEGARAKARAIVPALFLDTFGDPATNPKGWPVVPFSGVVENFRYGTNQKCSDERIDGAIPVLRIPNVIGANINWDDLKYAVLPDVEMHKLRLLRGDLLFVRTNGNPDYIGRCAEYEGEHQAAYASYLIRARLSESVSDFCLPALHASKLSSDGAPRRKDHRRKL